ncbi:MAG: AAA family ATPase [Desulfobacterales bacterium]|nr:AAA family ATPase [Desulfobacterales bacterium]
MIDRYAKGYLNSWLNKPMRKPLVLRGARQVGKSTLIREFARESNKALIEINLERHLFLDDISRVPSGTSPHPVLH